MKRFLLFIITALTMSVASFADTNDLGEVVLGKKYNVHFGDSTVATLHVRESGLLRVMCSASDYLRPYRDADRTDLIVYNASFYSDGQGYVINVTAGDVVYFMHPFCMNNSRVWFEMQSSQLTYTSVPAVGGRLVPTGRAQLELLFNMPVSTSGGTMTCAGRTVQLDAQRDNLYIIYEIKEIVMDWIESGIAAGTPIDVVLYDVQASISDAVKAGNGGVLRLRYYLPSMPGKMQGCNFEKRTFKSFWLDDDEEGLFRMSFSTPVSTTNPGNLILVYGNPEAMDAGSMEIPGKADGNDVVYDLRDISFTPKDFLESGTTYPTISVRPVGVYDSNGDLMYSPGRGSFASWTYELPYEYIVGSPWWEVFYANDDDISILQAGEEVCLYVNSYHVVKSDGIRLSFDDGKKEVVVPLDEVEVEYEIDGTTAALFFTVPSVNGQFSNVTITFDNYRLLTGADEEPLSETFPWKSEITTPVSTIGATAASAKVYDLQGRRARAGREGFIITSGRKSVR